jgi:hypothetical protein
MRNVTFSAIQRWRLGGAAEAGAATEAAVEADVVEEPGAADRKRYLTIFAPFIDSTTCFITTYHKLF